MPPEESWSRRASWIHRPMAAFAASRAKPMVEPDCGCGCSNKRRWVDHEVGVGVSDGKGGELPRSKNVRVLRGAIARDRVPLTGDVRILVDSVDGGNVFVRVDSRSGPTETRSIGTPVSLEIRSRWFTASRGKSRMDRAELISRLHPGSLS